ncbi:hypothetical protein L1987_86950 [Smallanthus sonchifolius]|uniref:Uncharacterized protein n=1 Tax=Smallanthus sonchifolius TaxID=185202 RepID=A0ACB8Y0P2_9ASTR|nr:hypothetical protein L1987_86950 [Smallanthus sonchifolius]
MCLTQGTDQVCCLIGTAGSYVCMMSVKDVPRWVDLISPNEDCQLLANDVGCLSTNDDGCPLSNECGLLIGKGRLNNGTSVNKGNNHGASVNEEGRTAVNRDNDWGTSVNKEGRTSVNEEGRTSVNEEGRTSVNED